MVPLVPRCILVGDSKQLPATVLASQPTSTSVQRSLFERLQDCGHPVHGMQQQYRMVQQICEFPSKQFYSGQLTTHTKIPKPVVQLYQKGGSQYCDAVLTQAVQAPCPLSDSWIQLVMLVALPRGDHNAILPKQRL